MGLIQPLEQLAERADLNAEDLKVLLRKLNAPNDGTRMLLVMENLAAALDAVQPRLAFVFSEQEDCVRQFNIALVRQLIKALQQHRNVCPEGWLDRSDKQHGIIAEHPEWAMLILPSSSPRYSDPLYRQHQGIVLCCAAAQRERHESIGSEIDGACRDIRRAARSRTFELLGLSHSPNLADYHAMLLDPTGDVDPGLRGIELLVRKIREVVGKSRFGSGHSKHVGSVLREIRKIDREDADAPGPKSESMFEQSSLSRTEQQQARQTGLHPGEYRTLSSHSVSYANEAPTAGFDLRDHQRRQKAQVQHLSTANQRLPFRFSQLTSIELSIAAKGASDLFQGKGLFVNRDPIARYSGLLLMLMIWLGRPVEQLLELRIYQSGSALPRNRKGLLGYLIDAKTFVLPIPSPQWRNNLKSDAQRLLYEVGGAEPVHVDDVIMVACPVRMSHHLNAVRHNAKATGRALYSVLFPEDQRAQILDELSTALSVMNRNAQLRLTALRISQALFDEITELSSDWTDASLLTGHTYTTSDVTAHYYSVTGEYLQTLYHNAVTSLRNRLYYYLGVEEQKFYAFEQTVHNPGDHGSKINAQPELIDLIVRHLKSQIRAGRRAMPGPDQRRQTHNALVSYLAFWILFSTGFRAVNDLVFRLREIDWKTGFLVVSDKDGDTTTSARTIWLSPALLEQFRQYARHLEVLQTRTLDHPTVDRHIEAVLSDPEPDEPLLFFLSEQWHTTQVSPNNLRNQVPEFSLPINLGRHYLRSRLRHLGCQAEYVNGFLGHWQHGQDPFGEYSSLTPAEMFQTLAPYVLQLQKEAGWTVQSGVAS